MCLLIGVRGHAVMLIPAAVIFAANFHCFILQRYNRIRLVRALGRALRN